MERVARGLNSMGIGAVRRGVAGLLLGLVIALVVAGCYDDDEPRRNPLNGDTFLPAERFESAQFLEYDGEMLVLRADFVTSSYGASLSPGQACVEVESHGKPCFYKRDGHPDEDILARRVRDQRYQAERLRVMSGRHRLSHRQDTDVGPDISWDCIVQGPDLESCSGRYNPSPRNAEQEQELRAAGYYDQRPSMDLLDLDFDADYAERHCVPHELYFDEYLAELGPDQNRQRVLFHGPNYCPANIRLAEGPSQVHFYFRIPGLEPGDKFTFYSGGRGGTVEMTLG